MKLERSRPIMNLYILLGLAAIKYSVFISLSKYLQINLSIALQEGKRIITVEN